MTKEDSTLRARRDGAILAHVALYRLTLSRVVERLFFSAEQFPDRAEAKKRANDTLCALVRQQELSVHRFPSGERYYTLYSARPGNAQSIDYDLVTLVICCLSERRYYRLETSELKKLFEKPPHHHVRHCLSDEVGGPVVYRIYPTKVDVKGTVAYIKKHLSESRNRYGLAPWLEMGDYGLIVATDTETKAEQIAKAICRPPSGSAALAEQVRVVVTVAPTSSSVPRL